MTTTSIAVDATPGNGEEQQTIWFQVLAFGKTAEALAKHTKGDLVSLSGRVSQSRWKGRGGEERTGLTIIADQVVSARTVRPGGRRKASQPTDHKPGPIEYYQQGGAANVPFNDDIPF